ncbi:MAG: hypothetical protein PVJ80_17205 [Gemmatimonadota bacterium]
MGVSIPSSLGWTKNLLLLLVATGTALLVAESVLAVAGVGWLAHKSGPTGSIRDVVMQLRAHGRHAVPRVPGNVLVDTGLRFATGDSWLYPIGPAPGDATVVLCADGPTEVIYDADRFGFNNPDRVWEQVEPDVAVVGDSYAAGVCVHRENQIPTLLSASRTTVNLAMSGAGPLRELANLKEYAHLLRPHLVVWIYYEGNDLWDLAGETTRPWLTAYLKPDGVQGLATRQPILDGPYEEWLDSIVAADDALGDPGSGGSALQFIVGLPRLRRLRDLLHVGELSVQGEPDLGLLPQVLEAARAEVETWDGRMLLVYMPDLARYDTWIGSGARGREEVLTLAETDDIATLDLDRVFREQGDPRYLWSQSSAHLNEQGYRVAAEAISRAVDSLLPATSQASD